MRAVIVTRPGTVELNWTWLPSFIGMSNIMKKAIEEELEPQLVGKELTDETLDWAHEQVIDILCKKHHAIVGLRDYLDALKFVTGTK